MRDPHRVVWRAGIPHRGAALTQTHFRHSRSGKAYPLRTAAPLPLSRLDEDSNRSCRIGPGAAKALGEHKRMTFMTFDTNPAHKRSDASVCRPDRDGF